MSRNLLADETSPYLLQHRDNPVHWHPWGPAALGAAKSADKPVLLSVGYAACHWCHVMAHESFEDSETAEVMNANFINIKVDREERPDIDRIYMNALQALGEHGGWPLTMFLTPDAEPFWGGTYFPPESRYGRPSFKYVLTEIVRIWRDERHKVAANSRAILDRLRREPAGGPAELSAEILDQAAAAFVRQVDPATGGLRGAPKFPQGPMFSFLWAMASRSAAPQAKVAVVTTLRNISQGGIYDHLGGGIARYSVDDRWLAPHFEKMLYDNAQYVALLARVWPATGDELFRIRMEETVSFLLRDMRTAEGAFASSYDADSEGEEGRFYVWTEDEIDAALPREDRSLFKQVYDVAPSGNWEGHTILNRLADKSVRSEQDEQRLRRCRDILLAHRATRTPPGFDDKCLADWNGLAVAAIADAALVRSNPIWTDAAAAAFSAVLRLLWTGEMLMHSWRAGKPRHLATAEGYANLIGAALSLYRLTAQPDFLSWAERLTAALDRFHADQARGGYYLASSQASDVILRQRSAQDDATPNANGVMLANLARLHHLTGKADYFGKAEGLHRAFAADALAAPFGHPSLLEGFAVLSDPVQIVLTGAPHGEPHPLLRHAVERLGPDPIILHASGETALPPNHPAHAKAEAGSAPRLYLCRGHTCAAPAETPQAIDEAIRLLGLVNATGPSVG